MIVVNFCSTLVIFLNLTVGLQSSMQLGRVSAIHRTWFRIGSMALLRALWERAPLIPKLCVWGVTYKTGNNYPYWRNTKYCVYGAACSQPRKWWAQSWLMNLPWKFETWLLDDGIGLHHTAIMSFSGQRVNRGCHASPLMSPLIQSETALFHKTTIMSAAMWNLIRFQIYLW